MNAKRGTRSVGGIGRTLNLCGRGRGAITPAIKAQKKAVALPCATALRGRWVNQGVGSDPVGVSAIRPLAALVLSATAGAGLEGKAAWAAQRISHVFAHVPAATAGAAAVPLAPGSRRRSWAALSHPTDHVAPRRRRPRRAPGILNWPLCAGEAAASRPGRRRTTDEDVGEPIIVLGSSPPSAVEPVPEPVAGSPGGPAHPGGGSSAAKDGMGRGLLKAPATARRVVYLLDRSMSMGPSGRMAAARREIAASLHQLTPNVLFQVIAYNRLAEPFDLDGQRENLTPAAPAAIEQAIRLLDDVQAGGATDHASGPPARRKLASLSRRPLPGHRRGQPQSRRRARPRSPPRPGTRHPPRRRAVALPGRRSKVPSPASRKAPAAAIAASPPIADLAGKRRFSSPP